MDEERASSLVAFLTILSAFATAGTFLSEPVVQLLVILEEAEGFYTLFVLICVNVKVVDC